MTCGIGIIKENRSRSFSREEKWRGQRIDRYRQMGQKETERQKKKILKYFFLPVSIAI